MENANKLKQKLQQGQFCLGVGISFNDGAVTEALCRVYDFAWIDTEHNGMTLERVEGHIVATRATGATALVRVPGTIRCWSSRFWTWAPTGSSFP